MINFQELYKALTGQKPGTQRKVDVNSCLEVFFGYSFDGNLRLSFMSKSVPPKIESTKILHVVQGRESNVTYWTSFDLLNIELKDAYFSFCENLIDSVTGLDDEASALRLLRRRFATWKTLFQKEAGNDLPKEKLLGIFGELRTLVDVLSPTYGVDDSIKSWGGPDMQSKDFTIGDTWYEVKTIGANTDKIHISSLTQLSSQNIGHLVVVRAEAVSPEFEGEKSSLIDVIKSILLNITDESVEVLFTQKIRDLGIDIFGNELSDRFDVKSINIYRVDDAFPRITERDIPYTEITGVTYSISTAAIERFKEA